MPTVVGRPLAKAKPRPSSNISKLARGIGTRESLDRWLRAESVNLARHAAGLRPFRYHEFGNTPASPSEAHRQAANKFLVELQRALFRTASLLRRAGKRASHAPSFENLEFFASLKERGQHSVQTAERVWDFYYRLFNQRQTPVGRLLLGGDRIAQDCYQVIFSGLGVPRSIPSPAPFTYMQTGHGPATFRRGVAMTLLAHRANPFPLIQLPYHRLLNPWTLGAVTHEAAHNLQGDLGLWPVLPKAIQGRLRQAGVDPGTSTIWGRWHKEIFADLCGLLLAGPAFVTSMMEVFAKSPRTTVRYDPRDPHPPAYLRVFLNLDLLDRMEFRDQAKAERELWERLYPARLARNIPVSIRRSFSKVGRLVVDTVCFTQYPHLGQRRLADVVNFGPKEAAMVDEAAGRLASGTDPGIIPERFLIGAARVALERRLARPGVISRNFYSALERR